MDRVFILNLVCKRYALALRNIGISLMSLCYSVYIASLIRHAPGCQGTSFSLRTMYMRTGEGGGGGGGVRELELM